MAAQWLSGRGFERVYNLNGGIRAWQGIKAKGPVELNLEIISGEETPAKMIEIAYGFEGALEKFYRTVIDQGRDQSVTALLKLLWAVEERHKRMLLELYQGLKSSADQELTPLDERSAGIMEGGFKFAEFLEQNEEVLQTPTGVLDLAMMIETQALDLYLRFGQKMALQSTKEILNQIADEEKGHLSALGKLLEEQI